MVRNVSHARTLIWDTEDTEDSEDSARGLTTLPRWVSAPSRPADIGHSVDVVLDSSVIVNY